MRTVYIYKKYKGREYKSLYKTISGQTEHECWKKLMSEEGLRNLTLAKTKFSMYREPKTVKKTAEKSKYKVNLKTFTEMYIGTYEAEKTKAGFIITLKDGRKMEFDETGLQIGVPVEKKRFANRIEWA